MNYVDEVTPIRALNLRKTFLSKHKHKMPSPSKKRNLLFLSFSRKQKPPKIPQKESSNTLFQLHKPQVSDIETFAVRDHDPTCHRLLVTSKRPTKQKPFQVDLRKGGEEN